MSTNNNRKKITLKDFTEKYTHILKNSSVEELRAILTAMANEIDSSSRQDFLAKLSPTRPKYHEPKTLESEIIDKIELIKEEILEKTNEEPDWEYDDEDSLAGYEGFIQPLSDKFDEVEALFDYGHYEIARKAYEGLFSIFNIEDDYGRGIRIYDLENTDLDEARARYLRSIYLTEKSDVRMNTLLDIMEKLDSLDFQERPKLNDMINISSETLPEFPLFLQQWIHATKSRSKRQYDTWNREATFLLHGISGLESLAKNEGSKRPRIYIDWIQGLINEKNYKAALDAVSSALKQLPQNKPIRAAIADLMTFCGQHLHDKKITFNGSWLSFEAKPTLPKLIDLYQQCDSQNRTSQMQLASDVIEMHMKRSDKHDYESSWEKDSIETPSRPSASLLLHAYLFSNENDKAFNLVQKGKPLGWSSSDNPQPLFVAYFLVRLTKKPFNKIPNTLKQFWNYALNTSQDSIWNYDENNNELFQNLEHIYREIFSVSCSVDEEIINWCLATAKKRVTAIVSNQHRKAYDRAALLTAACTETLALANPTEATKFFIAIKNKFPRHPAFQSELKKAGQLMQKGSVETIT